MHRLLIAGMTLLVACSGNLQTTTFQASQADFCAVDGSTENKQVNEGDGQRVTACKQSLVGHALSEVSVAFSMATTDTHQVVAYYDTQRNMSVAIRERGAAKWAQHTLPTQIAWDSHNFVVIAVDQAGYVHVSGNMHNVPLIYFRSTTPLQPGGSVAGFSRQGMTGEDESSVTYPQFFKNHSGELFFSFRSGGSGRGTTYWNQYDTATGTWQRLSPQGIFNGLGQANAYHNYTPISGPDGRFHIVYMWRATPSAATNKRIAVVSSKDLIHWETYSGTPIELPITPQTEVPGLVVDPVQAGGGLINIGYRLSWDAQQRPIVTYHKYDAQGDSQVFNTRLENGQWTIRQGSQWQDGFTWDLARHGSLEEEVLAQAINTDSAGNLVQVAYRSGFGTLTWVLDPKTLSVIKQSNCAPGSVPEGLADLRTPTLSEPPNTMVNLTRYPGDWYLRYETLPPNQDQNPGPPYPAPSPLKVYRIPPTNQGLLLPADDCPPPPDA